MIYGLGATAATGLDSAFPAIPVDLLRSSSLGGGLVSSFLGSGFVIPNQGLDSLVGLHPLAIAGFLGLIINSLALLPLGRKYSLYRSCLLESGRQSPTHNLHFLLPFDAHQIRTGEG